MAHFQGATATSEPCYSLGLTLVESEGQDRTSIHYPAFSTVALRLARRYSTPWIFKHGTFSKEPTTRLRLPPAVGPSETPQAEMPFMCDGAMSMLASRSGDVFHVGAAARNRSNYSRHSALMTSTISRRDT
jgi:hypothetical protein